MREIWKPIPGYEGFYEVSNLGNARRMKSGFGTHVGRLLKPHLSRHGYRRFALSVVRKENGVRHWQCHRCVWEAFKGPIPEGGQINHKNGLITDNRLENLEVVTPSENKLHSIYTLGRRPKAHPPGAHAGSKNANSKLTEADVLKIRKLIQVGFTQRQIATIYGIQPSSVSHIRTGKTWSTR